MDPSRERDQLERWLRRGQIEDFTTRETVTPELAALLLELNAENRPVRWKGPRRSVEAYAADMRRGEWELNGQAVIVSRDGFLNDGQHRCWAVIEADMPVEMHLCFGVSRGSRKTVDQGRVRTPADILSLKGEKNANVLGSAIQLVWCYQGDRVFSYRPSPEQLLETLDAHPGLRDAITETSKLSKEYKLGRGGVAAAHYLCTQADGQAATAFLRAVTTGLDIGSSSDPAFRLRVRFQLHLADRERLDLYEQAALFIKAFNLHRAGRTSRNLVWAASGAAGETFPTAGA